MFHGLRNKFKGFWKSRLTRRDFYVAAGFVLLIGLAVWGLWAHPVLATSPGTTNQSTSLPAGAFNWLLGIFSQLLLAIARFFIKITLFFLSFIIQIASYNGYLDSTAVDVGWVMVRDLTNMFFVVILLIIAFATILGIEQYEWKKLLIKFILAAVFVNFSRVIVGLLIDVSQLVMNTFVNGIVATAGGNIINMFNLNNLESLHASVETNEINGSTLFASSVAAITFAALAMGTMLIFVFMLLARMLRLWILIILSPLAFVLGVLPSTAQYAKQWWSELADNLVTGPVLLFFIWLSFVTLGTGNINSEIAGNVSNKAAAINSLGAEADKYADQKAGPTAAMGWDQMASFAIAVGMLFAGARVAASIGGESGSALSKVTDFGKKVATIASGYALGRFVYEKGVGGAKKAVVGTAKELGLGVYQFSGAESRVKVLQAKYKTGKANFMAKYGFNLPYRPTKLDESDKEVKEHEGVRQAVVNEKTGELVRYDKDVSAADSDDGKAHKKGEVKYETEMVRKKDAKGNDVFKRHATDVSAADSDDGRSHKAGEAVTDAEGNVQYEMVARKDKGKYVDEIDEETGEKYQRFVAVGEEYMKEVELSKWSWAQRLARNRAVRVIGAEKAQKKSEEMLETKKGIMAALTKGVPSSVLFKIEGEQGVDAMDRRYAGVLKQLKARSAAKTEQYEAIGGKLMGEIARAQWLPEDGFKKFKKKDLSQRAEMQYHKIEAAKLQAQLKHQDIQAKVRLQLGLVPAGGGAFAMAKDAQKALFDQAAAEEREKTLAKQYEAEQKKEKTKFMASTEGKEIRKGRAEAELDAKTLEQIMERLEDASRLGLVGSEAHEHMIKQQSFAKIAKDTLTSTESGKLSDAINERIKEGKKDDKQAQKDLQNAADISSDEAKEKYNQSKEALAYVNQYKFKEREIDKNIRNTDKDIEAAEQALADAEIRGNEDGMEEARTWLANALEKREKLKYIARNHKNRRRLATAKAKEATKLRNEGESIDEEKLSEEDKKKKKKLRERARTTRERSVAWQYAKAKAEEGEATLAYNVGHDAFLSEIEQLVVHDKRGIKTPTDALTKAIETYQRKFASMDYDMFVTNLGSSLQQFIGRKKRTDKIDKELEKADLSADKRDELLEEKKKVAITDADKAAMAGLLAHGVEHNWIDDAIWKYMEPELKSEMKKVFGWNDTEFNNKKINDVMSVFASGGDVQFSKIHTQMGDVMDYAVKELGISIEQFYEKLENKQFSSAEMSSIKNKLSGAFKKRFNFKDEAEAVSSIDDILLGDGADYYLKQLDDNQAQLQFIANMRDKAAASTHPENGGHGKFIKTSKGTRYAMLGEKLASDAVMGEVRKMTVQTRSKMQTHATANLDELGQFVTNVREREHNYTRGDINSANSHRGTNTRYLNQYSGLSADAAKEEYIDKSENNLGFLATGKKADGSNSERHQWIQNYDGVRDDDSGRTYKEIYDNIKSKYRSRQTMQTRDEDGNMVNIEDSVTAARQETSNQIAEDIFARNIRSNPKDFLLTMGQQSGVGDVEALAGNMHIALNVAGKPKHISHIRDFINLYNSGAFNWGKAPKRRLAPFREDEGRQRGGNVPGGGGAPPGRGGAPPGGGGPAPGGGVLPPQLPPANDNAGLLDQFGRPYRNAA